MAFENIGVGGILSFDSGAAVSNMRAAETGFSRLSGAGARLRSGLSDISAGLGRFNIAGGMLAMVGGLSFGGMLRSAFQFRMEMEKVNLSVATTISVVRGVPIAQGLEEARGVMVQLRRAAVSTAGEGVDLARIYGMVVGPLLAQQQTQEQIVNLTRDSAVLADAWGMNYGEVGSALSRMLSGQLENENALVRQLKATGQLADTSEQWRRRTPVERIQKIQEILGRFSEAGGVAGQTIGGLLASLNDIRKIVVDAFFSPVLERFRTFLVNSNTNLQDLTESLEEQAKVWGAKLVPVFEFAVRRIQDMIAGGRMVAEAFSRARTRIQAALSEVGVSFDSEVLDKIGKVAAMFLGAVAVLTPVLAVLGTVASHLGGILLIARGIAAIFAGPVGIALFAAGVVGVAAFRKMREEGITVGDVWTRIRSTAEGFTNHMAIRLEPAGQRFVGIWERTKSAVLDVFEGARPAMADFASRMDNTFGNQLIAVTNIANGVSRLLGSAWDIVLTIVDAMRPTLNDIIMFVGVIQEEVAAVWAEAAILFNKLTMLVEPIVNFLLPGLHGMYSILSTIASFAISVVRGAFVAVGGAVRSILQIFGSVVDLLTGNTMEAVAGFRRAIGTLGSAIIRAIHSPLKKVAEILVQITGALAGIAPAPLRSTLESMTAALQRVATITPEQAAAAFGFEAAPSPGGAVETRRVRRRITEAATEATAATRRAGAAGARQTPRPPDAEQPCVEAHIQQDTRMNVDGREVAGAVSRHQVEITERAGASLSPWQHRRLRTRSTGAGSIPGGGGG